MRLDRLDRGSSRVTTALFRLAHLITRQSIPDVMKVLLYRPRRLGRPFATATQQVMRGPSEWSVGERELFAAFTSQLNQCPF